MGTYYKLLIQRMHLTHAFNQYMDILISVTKKIVIWKPLLTPKIEKIFGYQ